MQESNVAFSTEIPKQETTVAEEQHVLEIQQEPLTQIDEKDIVGKVLSEEWIESGENAPVWLPKGKTEESMAHCKEAISKGFYKLWHNKRKVLDRVVVTEYTLHEFLLKCFYWWKKGYEPSLKSENYAWELFNARTVTLCKYEPDPEVKEDPVKKAFLEKYSDQAGAALVGVEDVPEKRGRKKKIV